MSDRTTHLDADGLWIPPDLRAFDAQVVFRTPRATIQHFGTDPLDAYYGMIDETHFGPADEFRDPKNPELAPDSVTIKRQGEKTVTLTVDLEAEIVTDGGIEPPAWAEETDGGYRCTVCGNAAADFSDIDHECIYQNDLVADGGRVPNHRFEIAEERPGISYGPSRDDERSDWTLSLYTRDGERIELHLGESAMYDLWTEVHDVPWPGRDDDRGDLQREIVERVERMDADQLHHVLGVLHAVEHYGGQR